MAIVLNRSGFTAPDINAGFGAAHNMFAHNVINDITAESTENLSQKSQIEESLSHFDINPWVKTKLQRAMDHIKQGNTGKALDILIKSINDISEEAPEKTALMFNYYKNELEERGLDQLANVLDAVFDNIDQNIDEENNLDIEELKYSRNPYKLQLN